MQKHEERVGSMVELRRWNEKGRSSEGDKITSTNKERRNRMVRRFQNDWQKRLNGLWSIQHSSGRARCSRWRAKEQRRVSHCENHLVVRFCFLRGGVWRIPLWPLSLSLSLSLCVCFNYVCHFVAGVSLRRKFEESLTLAACEPRWPLSGNGTNQPNQTANNNNDEETNERTNRPTDQPVMSPLLPYV